MRKNLRIAIKVKGFTFYPYFMKLTKAIETRQAGYRGINIRIVKDQKMVFDVECHDEKLVRIKATNFQHGNITSGWSPDTIDDLNARIKQLMNQIRDYIATHDDLSKPLLMASLYGSVSLLSIRNVEENMLQFLYLVTKEL